VNVRQALESVPFWHGGQEDAANYFSLLHVTQIVQMRKYLPERNIWAMALSADLQSISSSKRFPAFIFHRNLEQVALLALPGTGLVAK
jgi:hypothetical protein